MNEIAVALDWREIDVKQIGAELRFRFFGLRASVVSWVLAACATVAGLAIADAVNPELGPSVNGAVAILAGALVLRLRGLYLYRKLMRAILAAPCRQEASTIILDAEGITAPGALVYGRMPWRWITEIVERKDALLLLFSPVESIPLPDKGLPEGMTRAALKVQLETWRAAEGATE